MLRSEDFALKQNLNNVWVPDISDDDIVQTYSFKNAVSIHNVLKLTSSVHSHGK